MKLNDSITNYNGSTISAFMNRLQSIIRTIEEGDEVLVKEFTSASAPAEGDNVFHVNFVTFNEFQKYQGKEVKIPELLDLYERWTDIFWELAKANIGHYGNKHITNHLVGHRRILDTLSNFFESTVAD